MSPYQRNQQEKRRKNLFRKFHRWIGFTSALFLVNLAITGILLNHSNDLNLHKKYISSDWLVNWYGIHAPDQFICAQLEENKTQFCQVDSKIYKNDIPLINTNHSLIGIIEIEDLFYLATESEIHIFTRDFELVETIGVINGLPSSITEFGFILINQIKYLSIKSKETNWMFDQKNNRWKITQQTLHQNIKLDEPKQILLGKLKSIYLKNKISYLKLVQDLHSGQILNLSGKILTDISGLVIILLSISGFFAWKKRKKQ